MGHVDRREKDMTDGWWRMRVRTRAGAGWHIVAWTVVIALSVWLLVGRYYSDPVAIGLQAGVIVCAAVCLVRALVTAVAWRAPGRSVRPSGRHPEND
jgi:hypothetical protein